MNEEIISKVVGRDVPISTKHSIEIADFIRYKNIQKAKKQLQLTIKEEIAIPLKRFHKDRGHRKGEKMGPGFYPKKAAKHILELLKGLEANSKNKGMNTDLLFISKIVANKAAARWHMGRNRGRMRSTNIEIFAKEAKEKSKAKKSEKKEEKKW